MVNITIHNWQVYQQHSGPQCAVHTNPDFFETSYFLTWISPLSTQNQPLHPLTETAFFLNRSPEFLFVYFSFFFFFFWCDRLAICEILRVFLWTGPKFQTNSPTRHQLQKQGGSRGRVQGLPPPPDDLRLSNTTGIPQNMQICMIYLYSQQFTFGSHYVIAKSKAFVEIAFKICLRHQSVLLFLSGAPPLKKTCIHPLKNVFK